MNWVHPLTARDRQEGEQQRMASPDEIQKAFQAQQDVLAWMALIVTGDTKQASQSIVNASALAHAPGVFNDWLAQWARGATLKAAIQLAARKIATESVSSTPCNHGAHPCLSLDQVQELQNAWAVELILRLDTQARVALIARGVQNLALQECALLSGTTRAQVQLSYCRALCYCEANGLIGTEGLIVRDSSHDIPR